MRNLIYIFLLSIAIISCDKPYGKEPNELLSKSEMVDVLTDLYLNQQILNSTPTQDYSIKLAENSLYVFQENETTRQIFEDSFKFYYTKPTDYQKILDKVKDKLEEQLSEEELTKLKNSEAQFSAPQ